MIIIIKGLIIGMIVSLPIGPLGIMSIQRTINSGWKVGFLSGIGAAASDIFYSSSAVFGISFIDDLIHRHKYLIDGVTGVLFLIVGLNIFINAFEDRAIKEEPKRILHPALSNFLLGLSNPMTFLIFITIFAKLGMKVNAEEIIQNLIFIISIFTGSTILWFLTSNLINQFKRNFKIETFYFINKFIGILVILFGIYSIIKDIANI